MTTLGILLLIIGLGFVGPIIVNPILHFINFEIYRRSDWIKYNDSYCDKRFYRYTPDGKVEQIAPVRPTINDWWKEFSDDYGPYWWAPVTGVFCTIGFICNLTLKPISNAMQKLFNTIKDIKI